MITIELNRDTDTVSVIEEAKVMGDFPTSTAIAVYRSTSMTRHIEELVYELMNAVAGESARLVIVAEGEQHVKGVWQCR